MQPPCGGQEKVSTEANGRTVCCWGTDLHPVDVGGVVPPATHGGDGFTAAVGDHPARRFTRRDEATRRPVARVVAAAALELWRRGEVVKQAVQAEERERTLARTSCCSLSTASVMSSFPGWA